LRGNGRRCSAAGRADLGRMHTGVSRLPGMRPAARRSACSTPMPALFTRMSSRRSPPLLERIAWPLQLCGTRHGLRCRPRVTASAQGSVGRTGRPGEDAPPGFSASWDASGRTLSPHAARSDARAGC
jgi:hypothetical protein